MYICIYTYVRTHIHTYIHTHTYTHTHTYIHTYIHTYTHTHIHTHLSVYKHTPSLTIFHFSVIIPGGCTETMKKTPNVILSGMENYTMYRFSRVSSRVCVGLCTGLQELLCVSAIYDKKRQDCHLSTVSMETKEAALTLISNPATDYYERMLCKSR